MCFGLAFLTFLSLSVPPVATAFHDQIVVVATGEAESVGDVAAAVTVIDREEIDAAGTPSVAELLRRVPGVTVLRSGLDTGVTSLFTRGTASTQTLVLFDGVRLNSPFFGGYDWGLPLTAGLERVEVVRGPFSALYGGDAIGGVVELIPRRGQADELRVAVEGGGDAWRRADIAGSLRRGSWQVSATAATRDGEGDLVNDDFSSSVGMLDIGYDLDGGRVSLLVRRGASRTEVPFDGGVTTPERHTEAQELLVAAPLRFELGPHTSLAVTPSWVARELQFSDPGDPWGYVAADTRANTGGMSAVVRHGAGRHRLAVGGEWRRDRVTDGSSYGENLDGVQQTTRAVFVQDTVRLGRGFSLVGGLRWDATSEWGSETAPRVTLSWSGALGSSWIAWGEAFRAPGLGELHYPFFGNPDLVPERSRSLEAGTLVPVGGAGAALQIVAFRNRTRDLIQYDNALSTFANVARALQDGLELAAVVPVRRSSRLHLALTWLDARDADGAALLRRPEWSGSLTWRGPLGRGFQAEAAVTWIGDRQDLDPITLQRVANPGFVTTAASVRAEVTSWLALRVRGENLADRRYEEVRGYPAPRRRLLVAVETVIQ